MHQPLFSSENTTMLTFFKQQLSVAETSDECEAIIAMIRLCNWDLNYFKQDEDNPNHD